MHSLENNEAALNFIKAHLNDSLPNIALALSKRKELPKEYILNQINGIQKSKSKFPFLKDYPNYLFGSKKNISQASSEICANFKSTLFNGTKAIDLSGGMGIDTYFLSKFFDSIDYLEKDEDTYEISKKNFELLRANNINCFQGNSVDFIKNTSTKYDLVYIDPDRKVENQKVFKIEDSEPNVLELLPIILSKSKYCLIKLSPLIDIQSVIKSIDLPINIDILSIHNDCKEVLVTIQGNGLIHCRNWNKSYWQIFSFRLDEEKEIEIDYSDPQVFLYEPNVSILKAGAFKSIAKHFGLNKIAVNTHLYTSMQKIENFPGRTIKIEAIESPLKQKKQQWNLVNRNFGKDIDWIKKNYQIKDGGKQFLYACRNREEKPLFIFGSLVS
jgi:hypothetical protein